jgi:hypothetical protein
MRLGTPVKHTIADGIIVGSLFGTCVDYLILNRCQVPSSPGVGEGKRTEWCYIERSIPSMRYMQW